MMQPYPVYKQSSLNWLSQIPAHWDELPNIAIFQERIERGFEDNELLSVTMTEGIIRQSELETKKDISNENKSNYKRVRQGDIAYNKMRMWQGAVGYSRYEGIVSPAYVILRPKCKINPKYFHYLFRIPWYTNESYRNSYGIHDDQLSLRYVDFKRMYSPFPPNEEQDAIVAFLEEQTAVINQFLTNKRQLIALLEEQKQVVINTAVTQGLDTAVALKPSGIEWLGDIPAHWVVAPVYARFSVQLGKMLDTKRITGKHLKPYLRNVDVQWDEINVSDLPQMDFSETDKQKYSLKWGDLLVCEGGEVGRAAIWQNQLPECYYQKALHRLRPLSNRDDSRFMLYLLRNAVSCDVFIGGTEKATIYHLTAEKLKKHRFPFPSKSEQQEIVSYIEQKTAEINSAIERTQREIELIEEYRTTLIAHAVTGKIDVRHKFVSRS